MKLEKPLTLSQFVDEQIKLAVPDNYHFQNIINYNNFLKQPLRKEMFVNQFTEPICETKGLLMKQWQDAEKKVIFSTPNESENIDIIIIAAKTIGGYANAMSGELTLKNVTI